jgi:hypothetical protein
MMREREIRFMTYRVRYVEASMRLERESETKMWKLKLTSICYRQRAREKFFELGFGLVKQFVFFSRLGNF